MPSGSNPGRKCLRGRFAFVHLPVRRFNVGMRPRLVEITFATQHASDSTFPRFASESVVLVRSFLVVHLSPPVDYLVRHESFFEVAFP